MRNFTIFLALALPASMVSAQEVRPPASISRCKMCHDVASDRNGVGPTLRGVVGRKAGSVAGYSYSRALKNSKLLWDTKTLDRYLAAPAKLVPGTKMVVTLDKAEERSAIISYLAASAAPPTRR